MRVYRPRLRLLAGRAARLRRLYADLLECIDLRNDDRSPLRCLEGGEDKKDRSWRGYYLSSLFSVVPRQYSNNNDDENSEKTALKKQELAAAFRSMAATRSVDHHHGDVGADEESVLQAEKVAQKMQDKVVAIIREIGEIVVDSEVVVGTSKDGTSLRDDDVFEYFCEKAILALFVEIAKEKPSSTQDAADSSKKTTTSCFHGVVWCAKVKAQVLRTVSLLVSGLKETSALYFILSQHCINQLVLCMLPIHQWTDPAIEYILPAYTDLLKALAMQLGGSPELFPFFTVHDNKTEVASFPLFSALVQIATSTFAQSNSFVHATSLNLIVGLMHLSQDLPVHKWICKAEREQLCLSNHICSQLRRRYQKIARSTTGPVVDAVRSRAIGAQLSALKDQIDVLNDIFWCNITVLNVRLCETFLRQFVSVVLHDLLPAQNLKFLRVGVFDSDCIPEREAAAQASSITLSRLFLHLEYEPAIRMLAVALLHPRSFDLWGKSRKNNNNRHEYILTPALNAVVSDSNGSGETTATIPNPFRAEILKSLAGDYGEWRVFTSASVLENVFGSTMDMASLVMLEVVPNFEKKTSNNNDDDCPTAALEVALVSFLESKHSLTSVSAVALECASSLAVQYLHKEIMCLTKDGKDLSGLDQFFRESSLLGSLNAAKTRFYEKLLESQHALQVSDIFVDVIEAVVRSRYKRFTTTSQSGIESRSFVFQLSQHSSAANAAGPEPLIRTVRGVEFNEVDNTRFYAQMALHFRAICRVIDSFHCSLTETRDSTKGVDCRNVPKLDLVDEAGELSAMFGCLLDKPAIGTDLDLSGRTTFRFSTSARADNWNVTQNEQEESSNESSRLRTFSQEMIFRASSELLLVLDPTDMFIVTPFQNRQVNRGTILCCISLLDVIAAAPDGEGLHIAVRHENIGALIKNGNMVLEFESAGTCLIVAQYLDRCRNVLRQELYDKITKLFSTDSSSSADEAGGVAASEKSLVESSETAVATEIPHVKTL